MGPSPDQKYRANIFEAYDVKQERLFNALEECLKPQGVSPPHIGTRYWYEIHDPELEKKKPSEALL